MVIEIVDLPIKHCVFPCFLYVYQRVRHLRQPFLVIVDCESKIGVNTKRENLHHAKQE